LRFTNKTFILDVFIDFQCKLFRNKKKYVKYRKDLQ
jgi:hypothetical protein